MNSLARIVAVFVVTALIASHAQGSQAQVKSESAAQVERILGATKGWADVGSSADELAALGRSALPALLTSMAGGGGPSAPPYVRSTARLALQRLPLPSVRAFLRSSACKQLATRERIEAVRLLGRRGSRRDLQLLVRTVVCSPAVPPVPRALQSAFEEVLVALLERDVRAARTLAELFPRVPAALQAQVVRALGQEVTRERRELLIAILGRSPAADMLVLTEIGRHPVAEGHLEPWDAAHLRSYLDRKVDLVLAAIRAVSAVRDVDAVERLVELLAHDDGNVRAASHGALAQLTGVPLGLEASSWARWYVEESAWWLEQAEVLGERIRLGEPQDAAEALREVAGHRWRSAAAAQLLLPGLERGEQDLVAMTCRALRNVGHELAAPRLVPLLSHEAADVRSAAWHALKRITGSDYPLDSPLWRARVL